jgi:hypothetical protein
MERALPSDVIGSFIWALGIRSIIDSLRQKVAERGDEGSIRPPTQRVVTKL